METLQHKFVSSIPDQIDELTLYISMEYGTAIHKCVCGCGNEVVTPFSPTDWELNFNGKSVSLSPSIGNWSFKCQSHYWIVKNKVRYVSKWTYDEIDENRKADKKKKNEFYSGKQVVESEFEQQFVISEKLKDSNSKWNSFKTFVSELF